MADGVTTFLAPQNRVSLQQVKRHPSNCPIPRDASGLASYFMLQPPCRLARKSVHLIADCLATLIVFVWPFAEELTEYGVADQQEDPAMSETQPGIHTYYPESKSLHLDSLL